MIEPVSLVAWLKWVAAHHAATLCNVYAPIDEECDCGMPVGECIDCYGDAA